MNASVNYINTQETDKVLNITKEFKKNENIYQQGDTAAKYYKVISGIVVIGSFTAEGKMVFKSLVHEGEYFGDEVVSGLEERANFAMAFSKDVILEEHKASDFWSFPNHQKEVLKSSMERNLNIQNTMEVNSSLTVEDRVKSFLKKLADKKAINLLTGEKMVRMHVKHKELAFAVNSSRQCVSSIVSKFQKSGLIRMDRSSFILSAEF